MEWLCHFLSRNSITKKILNINSRSDFPQVLSATSHAYTSKDEESREPATIYLSALNVSYFGNNQDTLNNHVS